MMQIRYSKQTRIVLLVTAILFYLASISYFVQSFYPSFSWQTSLPYLAFGIFMILEGGMLSSIASKFHKVEAKRLCRGIALYEIAINPVFAVLTLFLSVVLPEGEKTWLYFLNLGITVALFFDRIAMAIYFHRRMKEGDTGYIALRNHSWIAASFLAVAFNFYILSAIKANGLSVAEIAEKGISAVSDVFSYITVWETLVGIVILLQSLLLTILTFYSAKEDEALDFRTDLALTKRVLAKYEIGFWIGNFATAILFVLALVSTVRLFQAYFSLAVLYGVVLLIRIPLFFRKKRVEHKYGKEPYRVFLKKHAILFYAATMLILYTVVSFIFARQTFSHIHEQVEGMNEFITFGIFVPWLFVKLALGIMEYRKARRSLDPTDLLNAYLDIMLAMFTLAKIMFIIADYTHIQWVETMNVIAGSAISIFCCYAAIRLLILAIYGLVGKREAFFKKMISVADPFSPLNIGNKPSEGEKRQAEENNEKTTLEEKEKNE